MKKFIFIFLFNLWILSIGAREYNYYDGNEKKTIYLKPDLLAEFGSSQPSKNSLVKKLDPDSQLIKQIGITYIHKVASSRIKNQIENAKFTKSLSQSSSKISEVFSNHPDGGSLMALPGNIIISFKKNLNESQIEGFLKNKNLKLIRKMTLLEKDYYIVEYKPGIACLEYANYLRTLAEIDTSTPDFWMEFEKR